MKYNRKDSRGILKFFVNNIQD